jgi:hypothetical protein
VTVTLARVDKRKLFHDNKLMRPPCISQAGSEKLVLHSLQGEGDNLPAVAASLAERSDNTLRRNMDFVNSHEGAWFLFCTHNEITCILASVTARPMP